MAFGTLVYFLPNNPIKNYIKEKTLIEYFGPVCTEPKAGQIVELVGRDQSTRKKRMKAIFKKGLYFNLSDSTVKCLLEKNKVPNHWYAKELEKFPKSYFHIELLQESTPMLGYYHVAILNEKGKITKIEKFGYGL